MADNRDKNKEDAQTEQGGAKDAPDTGSSDRVKGGGQGRGRSAEGQTGASDLGPDTGRDDSPGRSGEVY